jgi:tryptophanyl-tRNA synthetase
MGHKSFDPDHVFHHHHASPEKVAKYNAVNAGARAFAEIILTHTPAGPDQDAALRLLRETAMMANAGIALDGRLTKT